MALASILQNRIIGENEGFDSVGEDYLTYIERLEQHFDINEILSETNGEECYKLRKAYNLIVPVRPPASFLKARTPIVHRLLSVKPQHTERGFRLHEQNESGGETTFPRGVNLKLFQNCVRLIMIKP